MAKETSSVASATTQETPTLKEIPELYVTIDNLSFNEQRYFVQGTKKKYHEALLYIDELAGKNRVHTLVLRFLGKRYYEQDGDFWRALEDIAQKHGWEFKCYEARSDNELGHTDGKNPGLPIWPSDIPPP